jgi:hypothetical protein
MSISGAEILQTEALTLYYVGSQILNGNNMIPRRGDVN